MRKLIGLEGEEIRAHFTTQSGGDRVSDSPRDVCSISCETMTQEMPPAVGNFGHDSKLRPKAFLEKESSRRFRKKKNASPVFLCDSNCILLINEIEECGYGALECVQRIPQKKTKSIERFQNWKLLAANSVHPRDVSDVTLFSLRIIAGHGECIKRLE
jgi:hypothetical protein